MQPIDDIPSDVARQVRCVLTDIDDTLTIDGKLDASAYLALWRLEAAGISVVPVTGRPAGWCDLIARQWPVDGVIGENGAFAFYEVEGRLLRLFHPEAGEPEAAAARLVAVRTAILSEVPTSRVAKDQPYRLFDLAIDFCEEPPDLGLEAAETIEAIFRRFGAEARTSSIHVNGWFGGYTKLKMAQLFAQERWGWDLAHSPELFLYCGDSPNDVPMFKALPNSVGVANIQRFQHRLEVQPRYVTQKPGGAGFAELVDALLQKR